MRFLLHLAAATPACLLAVVAWRWIRRREWIGGSIVGVLGLICFGLHPAVQLGLDQMIGYPFAKGKEALAIEHEIVGRDYAYVVEKLGEPNRVRVETPVVTTATREVVHRGETYQAMDYFVSPMIYTATRFIVFLDEKGTVTSHRVKWEYRQGR